MSVAQLARAPACEAGNLRVRVPSDTLPGVIAQRESIDTKRYVGEVVNMYDRAYGEIEITRLLQS